MFKQLALASFILAALGCQSPEVERAALAARIQAKEDELKEHIKKGGPILVFRTTAANFKVDHYQDGNHDAGRFAGPMEFVPFARPQDLNGGNFVLTAIYTYYVQESTWEGNKHSIEYWYLGSLQTTRTASGPGASIVSLKFSK